MCQYHCKNLSYCLTYFILSWHEASTHQTRGYYHMAPFYSPQAPETFLGGPSNCPLSSHFDLFSQAQVGGQFSWVIVGVFLQTAWKKKIRWISILKH